MPVLVDWPRRLGNGQCCLRSRSPASRTCPVVSSRLDYPDGSATDQPAQRVPCPEAARGFGRSGLQARLGGLAGIGNAISTGTARSLSQPRPLADAAAKSCKLAKASLPGEAWVGGLAITSGAIRGNQVPELREALSAIVIVNPAVDANLQVKARIEPGRSVVPAKVLCPG